MRVRVRVRVRVEMAAAGREVTPEEVAHRRRAWLGFRV